MTPHPRRKRLTGEIMSRQKTHPGRIPAHPAQVKTEGPPDFRTARKRAIAQKKETRCQTDAGGVAGVVALTTSKYSS